MTKEPQPQKRAVGTKVSEDVLKAMRKEQARRTLRDEDVTLKDIHAEWLEEKAKVVLAAG